MLYKINSSKVSLKEMMWYGSFVPQLIGKVFRIQNPSSTDDPPVDSILPCQVAEEAIPESVHQTFAPLRAQLQNLGFHSPVFQYLHHSYTNTQYFWVSFMHTSGQVAARLTFRYWTTPIPARSHVFCSFVSAFEDGSWLITTSGKPDLLRPAQVHELRMTGAMPDQLWQAHAGELARAQGKKQALAITTPDEVNFTLENLHLSLRDFHLKRGVFADVSSADEAQLKALEVARQQAQQTGSAHPEVHAQIEALQQKQSNWTSVILLLVVSLLLFAGAGGARWDWKFALAIIPVLFFHELGHYIAMRAFKYRNLKMFFIPLFGAAVSGSNYNVPGWKKVIVSLAGPVPGIVVGVILAGVGLFFNIPWMNKLAMLMVLLNGFNLLPILPLDGGWVMHTLFFSRHYILDFIFRVLAVAGLAAWGLYGGDKVMFYLAIFMAIALPTAFKIARISMRLRAEQLPELSADSQTIPFLTAERIIGEVKNAFTKGMTPKMAAEHTLAIFESLNARPPGILATIFYTLVQVGSFAVAFVCLSFLFLAKPGQFAQVLGLESYEPTISVLCDSVSAASGHILGQGKEYQTFAATFPNGTDAARQIEGINPLLPTNAAARIFGSTLLVTYPSDNATLRDTLASRTESFSTNFFVHSDVFLGHLTLACVAPDEKTAREIEQLTSSYLAQPGNDYLLPVWLPAGEITEQDWAKYNQARATAGKFSSLYYTIMTNAEMRKLSQQVMKAQRRGDSAMVKKLQAETDTLRDQLKVEEINGLENETEVDREVLGLLKELPYSLGTFATNETQKAAHKEFLLRLGQIKFEDEKPVRQHAVYAARYGSVSQDGTQLQFGITFNDLFHGPAGLVQWLCARGCSDIKYRIYASSYGDEEEEEE